MSDRIFTRWDDTHSALWANQPIRLEHKMTVSEVRAEIEPEGFRFEKSLETLPRQHILIFRPASVQ